MDFTNPVILPSTLLIILLIAFAIAEVMHEFNQP